MNRVIRRPMKYCAQCVKGDDEHSTKCEKASFNIWHYVQFLDELKKTDPEKYDREMKDMVKEGKR